ncbi:MAG: hypothetical protein EOM91_16880 [Sphingobacteriia bacterium]|nr:hypothetical protein [Sphingobacteriia bacterium]
MTLTASPEGRISGQFTIPAGIPAGSKLVEFLGAQTQARATFIGRGTLKTEEFRLITTVVNRQRMSRPVDPIAQTFMLDRQRQVAAVDLWFCAVGTSNVLLQIRDVSLGIPTLDVVAEAILTPSEITTDGPTRFRFPPVVLEEGREYALVAMCNDAVSSLAVGEIGKFDAVAQKWVTEQPYQVGVLLSSSNNRTWTPHQTMDLTFRLIAADYDVETNTTEVGETRRVVALDPVDVVDADHLMVIAAVERPSEATSVVFNVGVGATTYTVMERQPFTLPSRYTGEVALEAVLVGTFTESPKLHRDIMLVSGKRIDGSTYISRAMETNGGTKLTAYYDVYLPGTASVSAQYQNSVGGWETLPVVGGTELGSDWQEVRCEITDLDQPEVRVKLTLNGSAIFRPRVKNLRVAII